MQRWIYKTIEENKKEMDENLDAYPKKIQNESINYFFKEENKTTIKTKEDIKLNEMGEKGWELVSVIELRDETHSRYRYYYKRENK